MCDKHESKLHLEVILHKKKSYIGINPKTRFAWKPTDIIENAQTRLSTGIPPVEEYPIAAPPAQTSLPLCQCLC